MLRRGRIIAHSVSSTTAQQSGVRERQTEFLEVFSMSEFVTKQIVAVQTLVVKLRERAEEGQGMVEYALILAFIAILVIVALKFLQPAINNTLNNVSNSL
jgi:pilus assembly protein Flp/PilA